MWPLRSSTEEGVATQGVVVAATGEASPHTAWWRM